MKVRVYDEFGALNSRDVFSAFKSGLYANGDQQTKSYEEADVVVIWSILFQGRMAPNKEIWDRAQADGKPVVVLEVGALNRGESWKVGINGINRKATFIEPFEDNRFGKFNTPVAEWKREGEFITLFTQRQDSTQWQGMRSAEAWCADQIREIRKVSSRDIVIRPHPRDKYIDLYKLKGLGVYFDVPKPLGIDQFNHNEIFERSYAIINHSSGPSVQAPLLGIHTICSPDSLAYEVSDSYSTLESPLCKDRTSWLETLAHTEWFTDEIEKGLVWKHLKLRLK
jgi:hypothetical protein